MVSFTRTLVAASVALAALSSAYADDRSYALDRRARAFGHRPAHMNAALVARDTPKRGGRRCRKSSAAPSASQGSDSGSSPSSASEPAPSPSSHHWTSESKSWSPASSASPKPSSSAAPSHSKEGSSSQQASSTGGNHWASDASSDKPAPSSSASSSSSSSSDKPAPSSSASSGSSGSSSGSTTLTGAAEGTHTGELTYYATGLGACGWTNSDSDYIAAIGEGLWTQYGFSNSNKLCGHKIALTYKGKTITVEAVDECPGCAATDLDLSPSAFAALAPQSEGRLTGATWKFIS